MRHRRSVGTQVDRDNWQQVRDLFDAVCELDPSQWRSELARLSADPVIIAETLELLEAQTCELGRARAPLDFAQRQIGGDAARLDNRLVDVRQNILHRFII